MQVNRYTQLPVAQYNPMSMQEMAFAPTFLRERHDATSQALSDLETSSNQYDVIDPYRVVANQIVNPLQEGISSVSEQLATKGVANSSAIQDAMKLKSQYTQAFGPSGAIGQLQGASKNYREKAAQIQEFFKDSPDIANYILAKLKPGEATYDKGQLQLGQMNTPNYVKDIPQQEILDRMDKAAASLKASDFGDYGIEGVQSLGGFDDLVTLASGEGVTAQRAMGLMDSLLSQEEKASIAQRGQLYGLSPEESIASFRNQLAGIANQRQYEKTSRNRIKITDEIGLASAKKLIDQSGLGALQLPGARMEILSETPFMNLKYVNNRIVSNDKNSITSKLTDLSDIDKFNYYNAQGQPVEASQAIKMTPSTGRSAAILGVKEGYTKKSKGTDVPELESQFLNLKESNPVLKNMSNEKALEHVQNYYKNMGQTFASQDVFKTNFDFVKNSLTGTMPTSTFINTQGQQRNLGQLAEEHGMTEEDIVKSFTPTGVGIRPNIGTVIEGSIVGSNGKKVNIFMEPDQRSKAIGSTTNAIMTHLYNGGDTGEVMTSYIDPETNEAIVGVRTYVVNNFSGDPIVIFTGAELSKEQLNAMVKNKSVEQIQEMFEPGTAKVQTTGELINATTTGVRNRLQGTKF